MKTASREQRRKLAKLSRYELVGIQVSAHALRALALSQRVHV
jgi:hypothetical protein